MATKTFTKLKGHRVEKTRYHIPFYTKEFFEPEGSNEEDGKSASKGSGVVKIPVKINADGGENRSNVTQCEIPSISHFDKNVEAVLTSILILKERVIKPKEIDDPNELIKTTQELLKLICVGTATTTLQQSLREARQYIFTEYLADEYEQDEVEEEILVDDEKAFFSFIEQPFEDEDLLEDMEDSDQNTAFLFHAYELAFWNSLNSVIFGADAYRAHKQQQDYLQMKIVKPYSVSVEAAFRRIDVLTSLLVLFPPASSRGLPATKEQWAAHDKKKKISSELKREIKYNLLPDLFGERFDDLETDWTEMSKQKFLSEAQKCEDSDNKIKNAKPNPKKRKAADEDSTANLNRVQRDRNQDGKGKKKGRITNSGTARECELCKAAGAPDFVYKSHYTNQCKKKDEFKKALSGGMAKRAQAFKEYRSSEKELLKELKLLKKIKKLKKQTTGGIRKRTFDPKDYAASESEDSMSE